MPQSAPHPRTVATLDKLDSVAWFRMSGIADLESVQQLTSWKDAACYASSTSWENLRIEAANRLRAELFQKDKLALKTWNERIGIVKPLARALVHDKLPAILDPAYAEAVRMAANWDILHLCMECEYLDQVEPGFYHALAFYYVSGHFPCGVEGDPAHGAMIIY